MFELSLAHLNAAHRDREIDADVRRRQILTVAGVPSRRADLRTTVPFGARPLARPLRTTER